jgi:hypothetical protein
MTAEMVERVQGLGDYCAGCGDPLAPGELVMWTRDGGTHEACLDDIDPEEGKTP